MAQVMQMEMLPLGSDSETCVEHDGGMATSASPAPGLGRKGTVGLVAAVASLAAVGAVTYRANASDSEFAQDGTIAMSSTTLSTVYKNTGCSNWAKIMLEPENPSIEQSEDACLARCRQTPSCAGYNYQKQDQCTTQPGILAGRETGACYLLGDVETCTKEQNDCWDLAYLKTPAPAAWKLSSPSTGCSNWESITIDKSKVSNHDACGKKCMEKKGCQRFNWRTHNVQEFNCYLMSGDCVHQTDHEWNLYRMNMVAPSLNQKWVKSAVDTGCLNWAEAKLGSVSLEYDPALCGSRCEAQPGCVAFGWQDRKSVV